MSFSGNNEVKYCPPGGDMCYILIDEVTTQSRLGLLQFSSVIIIVIR